MLKALVLHGFKSFADATRFEFPSGITVVVGPNGSGKSNIVDAIRWVLGEQSAKSLRGGEMADVIFKGSGNGQRKPANTAEVTIIFDNSAQLAEMDAAEVRVTRRVYRSGEGEYLINDEPCRLRDIRDLFRGTGVGADSYSLIEQGKVDMLLQASPRERRAIFEEAAGISRFKAKKVESQRRLDRVDQNLLRLSDIVEEVERRLKSLRNQATKARRYKEHTSRLKALRTRVGLSDFRMMSDQESSVEQQLQEVTSQLSTLDGAVNSAEQTAAQIEDRLAAIKEEARATGRRAATCREQIMGLETTSQLQRRTLEEIQAEESQCQNKFFELSYQAGNTLSALELVRASLDAAEQEYQLIQDQAEQADHELTSTAERLENQKTAELQQQQQHEERLRASSELASQLRDLESDLRLATGAIERDSKQHQQLRDQLDAAKGMLAEAEEEEQKLRSKLSEATQQQEEGMVENDRLLAETTQVAKELSQCQQQRTATSERLNVLQEVERRREGIGAGTKDLLAQAKSRPVGALGDIRGMVADLIEVKVEMAPLVDAALGERAQFIVTTGQRLIRAITDGSIRLRGRVGVISLSTLSCAQLAIDSRIGREEGVLGHAADLVHVEESWRELARHLLGATWFVRNMETALYLREKYKDGPWRFITSAGEALEADGTVFGGPRLASGGLVSRRSELRSLTQQLQKMSEEETLLGQKLKHLESERGEAELQVRKWSDLCKRIGDDFATIHAKAEAARQLVKQNKAHHDALGDGLSELRGRHADLANQQSAVSTSLEELESLVESLGKSLEVQRSELADLQGQRQEKQHAVTAKRIELAKGEQRREVARAEAVRCEKDSQDRARAVAEIAQQLQQCRARHRDVVQAILHATSQMAEVYLQLQMAERQLTAYRREEVKIGQLRAAKIAEAKQARQELQTVQQSRNSLQVRASELRMKREALADRMRDDYGIELTDQPNPGLEDRDQEAQASQTREQVEAEITDLRRKISNIGAVNMESLAELEELEERFGSLTAQYHDLVNAKESLERIIQRINIDSRRMFVDTLESIREGFQRLFRRAFGGGQADIIVEDDVDILDAGVDIVATPPGKHSLNISLLSGGERALTAVTLLLAVFRHRPSPFCILDEVDGPLDEANIGRFVDVLREFLATTKVVIVTHSKKTMSAATTLYGVTMQESGVSKRVSVQFNDVREDGSIITSDDAAEEDGEAA